ncbi:MAG TPA: porin, partial [Sphingopyxis sp.]|nr:porin [Sphingopyxis sp.]
MRHALTAALLATSMFSLPTAAHAQAMTAEEAAQLRAELAALKAQVQVLETRLDAATAQPAPAPAPTPVPPSVTAKPATEISWKGAPEIKTADGWSFKPRGRIQLDLASVDTPT